MPHPRVDASRVDVHRTRARARDARDARRAFRTRAFDAMKNHASVVAIAGERGVGKTTLVNGLIEYALTFRERDGSSERDAGERMADAREVRGDARARRRARCARDVTRGRMRGLTGAMDPARGDATRARRRRR